MVGVRFKENNDDAQVFYYQKNLQGDVVAIFDTAGNNQGSYSYDAFGNTTVSSYGTAGVASINPIRYRGYYFDDETDWYFLNARYYSPEWRRFISPDDTAYLDPKNVNGLNLYCYCGNDPINFVDPSGHEPISATIGLGLILLYTVSLICLGMVVATSVNTNIKPNNIPSIFEMDSENAYVAIKDLIVLYAAGLVIKQWYDSEEKHHIVARRDWRAAVSRFILNLDDVDIDIEDERNKVSMKKGYHRVLHTNLYYSILNFSMVMSYSIDGKDGVEWLLETYREVLGGLQ